jgi:hypothetical protein
MRLVATTAFSFAFALLLGLGRAEAIIVNYVVPLSGAEEVGPGDPDGTGTANLTLDTSTNSITWSIAVANRTSTPMYSRAAPCADRFRSWGRSRCSERAFWASPRRRTR